MSQLSGEESHIYKWDTSRMRGDVFRVSRSYGLRKMSRGFFEKKIPRNFRV
jgi:hypothetical protein